MAEVVADLIVILHFAFIVFVVLGGLLALKWRKAALLHIPCALWGVLIEVCGWICPLTPLEHRFREASGDSTYAGGFVDHYIMPLVYPADLTRTVQLVLAAAVLLINLLVYGWVFRKWSKRSGHTA